MTGAPRSKSFRYRLIQMQLLLTFIVLTACATAFIVNDLFIFKRVVERNLVSNAEILGHSLAPALEFSDKTETGDILKSLSAEPSIVFAMVTDKNGEIFGTFSQGGGSPPLTAEDFADSGSRFRNGYFMLNYAIAEKGEIHGYLFLKSDLSIFAQGYRNYFWIVICMFAGSLLGSFLLVHLTQGALSQPIVDLAEMAKSISVSGNYSLRISPGPVHDSIEEVRVLSAEFNTMLEQIHAQDIKIQSVNEGLERKVQERTCELQDIQRVALENAHEAGMAEIATGILHNIGNITNSINVSAEELRRLAHASKVTSLIKANEILKENMGNTGRFFTDDPRGKVLPEFYVRVGELLAAENEMLKEEIAAIAGKIALVKDVVHTQQEYAKKGLFMERVHLGAVVDEILLLQRTSLIRHDVEVVKKYDCLPEVDVQKVKFAHVLMNLIKNGKEAMKNIRGRRQLTIEIGEGPSGGPYLRVTDTGEGVSAENLARIFTHGFTTKREGHGFGLHFCSNAMKEMGGDLSVESAGPGLGCSFTIGFKSPAKGKELKYA